MHDTSEPILVVYEDCGAQHGYKVGVWQEQGTPTSCQYCQMAISIQRDASLAKSPHSD